MTANGLTDLLVLLVTDLGKCKTVLKTPLSLQSLQIQLRRRLTVRAFVLNQIILCANTINKKQALLAQMVLAHHPARRPILRVERHLTILALIAHHNKLSNKKINNKLIKYSRIDPIDGLSVI